ncbi:hypothetical protein [Kistimonas asteriae]|uniref:hypothetical protein n=1 Tax=Kistimonas asteriae TaxID=517724 RepID=UPI001BA799CC|nr:hypothetical protein [Kistimonas asteriae]
MQSRPLPPSYHQSQSQGDFDQNVQAKVEEECRLGVKTINEVLEKYQDCRIQTNILRRVVTLHNQKFRDHPEYQVMPLGVSTAPEQPAPFQPQPAYPQQPIVASAPYPAGPQAAYAVSPQPVLAAAKPESPVIKFLTEKHDAIVLLSYSSITTITDSLRNNGIITTDEADKAVNENKSISKDKARALLSLLRSKLEACASLTGQFEIYKVFKESLSKHCSPYGIRNLNMPEFSITESRPDVSLQQRFKQMPYSVEEEGSEKGWKE